MIKKKIPYNFYILMVIIRRVIMNNQHLCLINLFDWDGAFLHCINSGAVQETIVRCILVWDEHNLIYYSQSVLKLCSPKPGTMQWRTLPDQSNPFRWRLDRRMEGCIGEYLVECFTAIHPSRHRKYWTLFQLMNGTKAVQSLMLSIEGFRN